MVVTAGEPTADAQQTAGTPSTNVSAVSVVPIPSNSLSAIPETVNPSEQHTPDDVLQEASAEGYASEFVPTFITQEPLLNRYASEVGITLRNRGRMSPDSLPYDMFEMRPVPHEEDAVGVLPAVDVVEGFYFVFYLRLGICLFALLVIVFGQLIA